MGYRNDLAAAQARADATMADLKAEREAREGDTDRIATLERTLAESLQELAALRAEAPKPGRPKSEPTPKPGLIVFSALAAIVCMVVLGMLTFKKNTKREPAPEFLVYEETPAQFDATAHIPIAKGAATRFFNEEFESGPFLKSLEATAVADDGFNQFRYGQVEYNYVVNLVPQKVLPSSAPVGTRTKQHDDRVCKVTVSASGEGIRYPNPDDSLRMDLFDTPQFGVCAGRSFVPRCSIVEIRKRSLAAGAPRGALANVSIYAGGPWVVRIADRGELLFEGSYPDDC